MYISAHADPLADIQYAPDFDNVEWGKPFSFQEMREQLKKLSEG